MSEVVLQRLLAEYGAWRKKKPPGFNVKFSKNPDGTRNMLIWKCYIPGNINVFSVWHGRKYIMIMTFSKDYPKKPPHCVFKPLIFHPNVDRFGNVYSAMLDEKKGWRPNFTVREILLKIQDLLDNPDTKNSNNSLANTFYCEVRDTYNEFVVANVKRFKSYTPKQWQ